MTEALTAPAPLAIIVAVARNGVIGRAGDLPWHISEDLQHFKKTTRGHAIIMGRKTHESIGRALPKRRNIVVTGGRATFDGCEVARNVDAAIAMARDTDPCPFVIGGASLYEAVLPIATEIHLTTVDRDVDGDTHFPTDLPDFEEVESRHGDTPGVTFRVLRRRL